MLISKEVTLKWNAKIKKHYVDLGYKYTKMGDEFKVKIEDLTKGSSAKVDVICDYCGQIYQVSWYSYYKLKQKENNTDCCSNPECTYIKSKESIKSKYGVTNVRMLDFINEKIANTNLERYGCENPFGNKEVQDKIKKYNEENYGVSYSMQRPDVIEKAKQTCLEKYGVENYGKLYSETHTKELSPVWKGGITHNREERSTLEYRRWRKSVFERDLYTCKCCGMKNGIGNGYVELHAHHIYNWKDNVELRYSIDNGITLCSDCHNKFHSLYGKKQNNIQQIKEFIQSIDKKIC